MDFALDEEQLSLQSAVRDLIATHADLSLVRSVFEDQDGDGDPPGLWARLADQGWPAVLVPQEYDGLGMSLLDAAVIARCLGAGAVPGPFATSAIGGEAVRLAGSAEQKTQWLPALGEGRARFASALLRPGAAYDSPGDGVTAKDGRLTGEVGQVEYAHLADRLVVAATAGSELGLWLVDPAEIGVTITRTPVLDGTTRTSVVALSDVPSEFLPGSSGSAVTELVNRATVLAANDLVGVARTSLETTVDYLKTREQFGRVVGSFQALKHNLADLLVSLTMAEHAAYYAAHALDAGLPDASVAVSVAKAKASDAAHVATARLIQYHGGIGYTWEHDAHFFFKRARRLEQTYGDAAQHRERIASLVL
jgi:alkylation response protein AidB-like acyl-CoA dehydrogenase